MMILAIALSCVLLVIAAIHMLWGFGYWFPIKDEGALVRAVVGVRNVDRMPGPIPCGLVTAAILVVLVALWLPPHTLRTVILIIAALVFGLRGGIAYLRFWRKMTPQEPFATYDRRFYGPLCLGIGLLLIILLGAM